MNESILFVLNLRQNISSGLMSIANTSNSVFTGVDKRLSNTQRQFNATGKSVNELNAQITHLTQKRDLSIGIADVARANREIEQLERKVSRLNTAGRHDSLGGGGLRVPGFMSAAMLGGGLLAGVTYIAKAGAQAQSDIIGLTTFLGKKQANDVYAEIQKDAALTPFNTKEILQVNRALISAGVSVKDARMDWIALGNAVSAVGGSGYALERMGQNMQQVKNKGHADAVDIRQFADVGVNIPQLIANATGKKIKEVSEMTVTYNLLSYALRKASEEGGIFAHAMERQSESIGGKWSTLLDNVERSSATIGMAQSGAITGMIDKLIKLTDRLPAIAIEHEAAISTVANGVIKFVGTLVDMAKWVYHNWGLVKAAIISFYSFRVAVWAASSITAIYNGVLAISAIRTASLAAAEIEATVATEGLTSALLLNPWVLVGAAIAGVIALLVKYNNTKVEDKLPTLKPGDRLVSPASMGAPGIADYHSGRADWYASPNGKGGSYVWKKDQRERWGTLDTWDADRPGFQKQHPKITDKFELHDMYLKAKAVADSMAMSQMVIYDPKNSISDPKALAASKWVPTKEELDEERDNTITGGGKRNITINARFAEHFEVHAATLQDAARQSKEYFMECFLEVLESARNAG